jgi:flagellar motor switch protein FliG
MRPLNITNSDNRIICSAVRLHIEPIISPGISPVQRGFIKGRLMLSNLVDVDDRGIQALMREVSTDLLVVALKGADPLVQEKIFKNMSKRAAELLRDDLEAKGPVKVSEVEASQKEILTIARRLADAGEIVLGGGGEAMM